MLLATYEYFLGESLIPPELLVKIGLCSMLSLVGEEVDRRC